MEALNHSFSTNLLSIKCHFSFAEYFGFENVHAFYFHRKFTLCWNSWNLSQFSKSLICLTFPVLSKVGESGQEGLDSVTEQLDKIEHKGKREKARKLFFWLLCDQDLTFLLFHSEGMALVEGGKIA